MPSQYTFYKIQKTIYKLFENAGNGRDIMDELINVGESIIESGVRSNAVEIVEAVRLGQHGKM